MIYLTGTLQEVIAAEARISLNCGFPSNGTVRWAIPRRTNQGIWLIEKPVTYNQFTQEQMMQGVAASEIECDPIWEG